MSNLARTKKYDKNHWGHFNPLTSVLGEKEKKMSHCVTLIYFKYVQINISSSFTDRFLGKMKLKKKSQLLLVNRHQVKKSPLRFFFWT